MLEGTAATFGADAGMTEVQLMGITGHKSTASLQKYVDNSIVQKRTAAVAFSVSGTSVDAVGKENVKPRQAVTVTKKSGRGNIEIILHNSTVNNVKVIQRGTNSKEEEEDDEEDNDYDENDV